MNRRTLLVLATGLCTSFICGVTNVHAETAWSPSGPIKLMIAFKAGGGVDTQARLIAAELEERHGWKVIPEQAAGKGGLNLASKLKKSVNDGTVIGMTVTDSLTYNMIAAPKSRLKLSDFTPLVTTASTQMGIVSKSGRGWNDMNDVIQDAKSGKAIKFGSMSPKLSDIAYLLGKAHGIDFNIINLKGGKAVMNGINADDIDMGWASGIQSKAVLSGDMVNLASGLDVPLDISPNAPLLSDLGVDFQAGAYFTFVAPAGLSPEVRQTLSTAIEEIVTDPTTKAGALIQKVFGRADVIQGQLLDDYLEETTKASQKLLEAASE